MKAAIPILLLVAGGYGALTTLMYLLQERLLFHPTRELSRTPNDVGLPYEDVRITTSDEETIHGWWVPHEDAFATLLLFHGNAGNISGRVETLRRLHPLGINIFIFDYRGYGQSTGSPTEEGLYKDTEAVWQYLVRERSIPPSELIMHGRSLGGGPATWLCERVECAALILESTFTSIPDAGAYHYPYLPVRLLARIEFDNLSRIVRCRCPILVMHSPDDDIIPFEQGERLFEAAPDPKKFMELSGRHNERHAEAHHRYLAGMSAFLANHVLHRRKEPI